MNARQTLISKLSQDSLGGIATLSDVDNAVQLVDAHAAEVLARVTNPADAATIYADRLCVCGEDSCPTWCPASVPTDERIAEIRSGGGGPLTSRELSWLKGAAARHEMHVVGSRGGHWPLQDPAGGLLLVSQYLAAAVAVIERAGLVEEKASDTEPTVTPDFFEPGHSYTHRNGTDFHCVTVTAHPQSGERLAMGWHVDGWGLHVPTTVGIDQWRHEYDGVQAPQSTGDSE